MEPSCLPIRLVTMDVAPEPESPGAPACLARSRAPHLEAHCRGRRPGSSSSGPASPPGRRAAASRQPRHAVERRPWNSRVGRDCLRRVAAGHRLRVARRSRPSARRMGRSQACASYSVGSLVNTFVPANLGEGVRAVLFGRDTAGDGQPCVHRRRGHRRRRSCAGARAHAPVRGGTRRRLPRPGSLLAPASLAVIVTVAVLVVRRRPCDSRLAGSERRPRRSSAGRRSAFASSAGRRSRPPRASSPRPPSPPR